MMIHLPFLCSLPSPFCCLHQRFHLSSAAPFKTLSFPSTTLSSLSLSLSLFSHFPTVISCASLLHFFSFSCLCSAFAVEKGGVYSDMGKYIRKAKVSGEVAVMEVSHQSSLGVRTRARTMAAAAAQDSSRGYLELRSRRLEKPLPPPSVCKPSKDTPRPDPNPNSEPNPRVSSQKSSSSSIAYSGPLGSVSTMRCSAADAEVSFGENILEADVLDRFSRETTPCSLIRDPEAIQTPGSTNRPARSMATSLRPQSVCHNIPTAQELEEFFAGAEQLQQRIFIERYNFDPVNDCPLPGRYEWVKVDF
ncbi:unnamed protein product [Musa banksii]